MAPKSSHARYRQAHLAGAEGRELSPSSRALADDDPLIDQAHDAGRAGVPFADFARDNLDEEASSPSSSAPTPSSSSPSSTPAPLRFAAAKLSGGRTESVGAVLLGFVLAALVLSVIDYGPKGPLYWFEAKFLNDAQAGPSASSSSTPSNVVPIGGGYPSGPLGPLGPIGPGVTTNAVAG